MSGAPLITHMSITAAIITRTRPTPRTIKGAFPRFQKRGSRFGDIGGTSLFGAWAGGSTGHADVVFAASSVRTTVGSPTVSALGIACGIAVRNG